MTEPNRRGLLRNLAILPLVGGSIALIGKPTAAAVPITNDLLFSYKAWLCHEHFMLSHELVGYDADRAQVMQGQFYAEVPGFDWHFSFPNPKHRLAGWPDAPQPSTRAAIVLSAVGCPLTEGDS